VREDRAGGSEGECERGSGARPLAERERALEGGEGQKRCERVAAPLDAVENRKR